MGNNKEKKALKLKDKLIIVMVLCIAVPTLLMVMWSIIYTTSVNERMSSEIDAKYVKFAESTLSKLDTMEDFALSIALDTFIKDALDETSGSISKEETINKLTQYAMTKINFFGRYNLFAINFDESVGCDMVYSISTSDTALYYNRFIKSRIKEQENSTQDFTGYYFSNNGTFYFRKLHDSNFNHYATIVLRMDTNYVFSDFVDNNSEIRINLSNDRYIPYVSNNFSEEYRKFDLKIKPTALNGVSNLASHVYETKGERVLLQGAISTGEEVFFYNAIFPKSFMRVNDFMYVIYIGVTLLISAPLLFYVANILYKNIMGPIDKLLGGMEEVKQGHFGKQLGITYNDEIGTILSGFNDMSANLKLLVEKAAKEELMAKEAKLSALQSRINPHFLYNTLELINWTARISNNEKISYMIENLSTLLNDSMDREGKKKVTLYRELDVLESYINILKVRFEKNLVIDYQIEDDTLECVVPKLILQPIVENAVKYAIEAVGKGVITISSKLEEGNLIVSVSDDGVGIDEEKMELLRKELNNNTETRHIGLRNVNNRIKLIYGDGYGVLIGRENNNTIISLKMRAEYENKD